MLISLKTGRTWLPDEARFFFLQPQSRLAPKAGKDFQIQNYTSNPTYTVNTFTGDEAIPYTIGVQGMGNYTDTNSCDCKIVPKSVTVTPDDQTIVRGDPCPAFTWTSGDAADDGRLKEDGLTFGVTEDISVPGTHPITVQQRYRDGGNYRVDYREGTLTVLDIFTVTFETGGGSAVPAQSVTEGKTAVRPSSDPTQSEKKFIGWFTDANCTQAYDFSTPVKAALILYAGWENASVPAPTPTPTPTPTPVPTSTPAPDADPVIIEGQNNEWTESSQGKLKFRSDADYSTFIRVEVDDRTVDPVNYISASGSTVVYLKPAFLKSLKPGRHKLAIVSKLGNVEKKAQTYFTIKPAVIPPVPATGDSTPTALLLLLCIASAGTAFLLLKRRKQR